VTTAPHHVGDASVIPHASEEGSGSEVYAAGMYTIFAIAEHFAQRLGMLPAAGDLNGQPAPPTGYIRSGSLKLT